MAEVAIRSILSLVNLWQVATIGSLSIICMSKSNCHLTVGNIPYGVTEEMLTEIFSEVGPVKYFR